MKKERQEMVLKALGGNGYSVTGDGSVYRRGDVVRGKVMASGFVQYRIYPGRGLGAGISVYGHNLVWLAVHGAFDPAKFKVRHRDGNRGNNVIANLELAARRMDDNRGGKIRKDQIDDIKFYLRAGVTNHSEIARKIGRGRQATRCAIKKLQAGKPLKYENGDYVPSPRNMMLSSMSPEQRAEYVRMRNAEQCD